MSFKLSDLIQSVPKKANDPYEEDATIFENKAGIACDMHFLASMPELCDVTFLVGPNREPVCGVKAILAARSKVFYQTFYVLEPSPVSPKKDPKEKFCALMRIRSDSSLSALSSASTSSSGSFSTNPMGLGIHRILKITEFEPDVMRQLVEYAHTGCVTLQPRTLLGLMCAADKYAMEQLRKACNGFAQACINVDTVCALLQSADRYVQYKCTKTFLRQVLEFIDHRGNDILNLGSFALLPVHIVRLILSRKGLIADEFTKFQAALMWTMKFSDLNKSVDWKVVFRNNFMEIIQFHKIPATVLMKEIDPLKLIPNELIMAALAFQADPTCVKPEDLIKGLTIKDPDAPPTTTTTTSVVPNLVIEPAPMIDLRFSQSSSLNTSCDTIEALPYDGIHRPQAPSTPK